MARRLAYLDSSALVKLAVRERESAAVRRFVRGRTLTSSALARVETLRAVRPLGGPAVRRMRDVLDRVPMIHLDDALLEAAAHLDPPSLRSLDAIHLASALEIAGDLGSFVTYDARMRAAADELGLPVAAPA